MLLRRITDHVKVQNWTAIAIDFVIVVVAVFIGIQASNWNEDRQNASRTQNYYSRLIDDLDSERRALFARLDYMVVTDRHAQSALATLSDPSAKKTSKFLVAVYQASQIWTYSVQRATYDEILSSGVAEAIPEPELRTHLANIFLNAEATRQIIVAYPLPSTDSALPTQQHSVRYSRELVQRLASIAVKRSAINAHLLLVDSLIEELRNRQR